MQVRGEHERDHAGIRGVLIAAFRDPDNPDLEPVEAGLVEVLRGSDAWLPSLSLVAIDTDRIVGQVLCTRAWVDQTPVLALAPIAVEPRVQGIGTGSLLMTTAIGEANRLGEPLIGLVGSPGYYSRFGFVSGKSLGITPPIPAWDPFFQVKPLDAYRTDVTGRFLYAAPFYEF
jgi:putative acetyltransferase